MNLRMAEGKKKGLQAVVNSRGMIAALAIDQRSALRKLFASAMQMKPESVSPEKLVQFKEAVSRALTPHASAILLDPEHGLSAARQRAKDAGLLLAYDKGVESARIKPKVVACGMKEFSKPQYRVDVLKVGVPVNMSFVQGSPSCQDILYRRTEAVTHFRCAAAAARIPFIYLSEGVSNETFQYALELAAEAGAKFSAVLCGRATWQEGVCVFVKRGSEALEDWLTPQGVQNIESVNRCLGAAHPWFADWSKAEKARPPRRKGKVRL